MIQSLQKIFKRQFPDIDIDLRVDYAETISFGSGITVCTNIYPFGSSIVGRKGISSEKVSLEIFNQFTIDWNHGGILDKFMADQIIPLMSLTPSSMITTGSPLSNHVLTNMWVVKKFLPLDFEISSLNPHLVSISTKKV